MSILYETGAEYVGQNPALIGYQNYSGTVVASSFVLSNPPENTTDGYTFDFWEAGGTGDQSLTFDFGSQSPVDYVAIAAHNLVDAGVTSIEIATSDGGAFVTRYTTTAIENAPLVLHMVNRSHIKWRITFKGSASAVRIGVVYIGQLLQMQRTIYEGLSVPSLSREENRIPNLSEGGQFLGALITREFYKSNLSWENLTPAWYRENFEPFVLASQTQPFFIAWRPGDFPDEVVYGWRTNNVKPRNTGPVGFMSVGLDIEAVTNG